MSLGNAPFLQCQLHPSSPSLPCSPLLSLTLLRGLRNNIGLTFLMAEVGKDRLKLLLFAFINHVNFSSLEGRKECCARESQHPGVEDTRETSGPSQLLLLCPGVRGTRSPPSTLVHTQGPSGVCRDCECVLLQGAGGDHSRVAETFTLMAAIRLLFHRACLPEEET